MSKKALHYLFLFIMILFSFMTLIVLCSLNKNIIENSSDYSLGFFPFDLFHFFLTFIAFFSTIITIYSYVHYRKELNSSFRKQKQKKAMSYTTFSHFISMCTIFLTTAQFFTMKDVDTLTPLLSSIIILNFILLLVNIMLSILIQKNTKHENTLFYQSSCKANTRLHRIFLILLVLALLYHLLFNFTLLAFVLLLFIFMLTSIIYLLEITNKNEA